jgi:hypothetical protein
MSSGIDAYSVLQLASMVIRDHGIDITESMGVSVLQMIPYMGVLGYYRPY